jgi:pyruvate ferredoxin oxidoreductase gamma subunit
MYGPERRGAPVTAYVRLSKERIMERGFIYYPHVVIIADETLINDPYAAPLSGIKRGVIFINSTSKPKIEVDGIVQYYDVTGLAIKYLGRSWAISAGIGSIASKLFGFKRENVVKAVETELEEIGLTPDAIEMNVKMAMECYDAIDEVNIDKFIGEAGGGEPEYNIIRIKYDLGTLGIATISRLGNTETRHTGSWRIIRPVIHYDKCNGCMLCFVYCPEPCIYINDEGKPVIDYDYCKGCLICTSICPLRAIENVREVRVI